MFSATAPEQIAQLATDVLRLSDYFIQNPSAQTPWNENYCQNAYRNYFLPLNYLRAAGVIQRGLQVNFFTGFQTSIDWGAGPGTASYAVADILKDQISNQILIEKSSTALKKFSDLHGRLIRPESTTVLSLKDLNCAPDRSLLIFSYSLTEMASLPPNWDQFEGLMILEPATSQDGRKLLSLRQTLIEKGYFIWAPCTHQNTCPLLTESKNDWCHDRFHVDAPEWFDQLEENLPMRNRTVTTSYVLARKTKPTADLFGRARLTGDSLKENGKTRQLMCRGPAREFLTWMHKEIEPQTLDRGELIEVPKQTTAKSNEIRTQQVVDLAYGVSRQP